MQNLVAYLCAIMAAVQSRSVLYRNSVLELILPNNHVEGTHIVNDSSTANSVDTDFEEWKYSVHDFTSKIMKSLRHRFQFKSSANDASSPEYEVSSTSPNPDFTTTPQESLDINEVPKDASEEIAGIPFVIPSSGGNITRNMLFDISKSNLAKYVFANELPGLAAFEYHN